MADFDNQHVFIALATFWLLLVLIKCAIAKKFPDNSVIHNSIVVALSAYSTYGVIRLTLLVLDKENNFADDLIIPMFLAVVFSFSSCVVTLRDLFTK